MISKFFLLALKKLWPGNHFTRKLRKRFSRISPPRAITYEGVYKDFQHARMNEVNLTSYIVGEWLQNEIHKLEESLKRNLSDQEVTGNHRDHNLLLVAGAINQNEIRILDVGSGFGNTYFYLNTKLTRKISYTAVELDEIVTSLNQRIVGYENFLACSFDNIPSINYDLIYFGSSLQYVEDYKNFLIQLFQLNSPLIFLSDTPMGHVEAFVTVQVNMKDRRILRWVFSENELIELFKNNGYSLVAKLQENLHQDIHNFYNFSFEYHHIRHQNLLFARIN